MSHISVNFLLISENYLFFCMAPKAYCEFKVSFGQQINCQLKMRDIHVIEKNPSCTFRQNLAYNFAVMHPVYRYMLWLVMLVINKIPSQLVLHIAIIAASITFYFYLLIVDDKFCFIDYDITLVSDLDNVCVTVQSWF